jgi:sugar transferase (PEP-CTERM/EpsH1 system associated)
MKLLLLTPQLPYPPQQGTTLRNFNIIKHLAPRHTITLLSFGTLDEVQNAAPLRELCQRIEIATYPTRTLAQRAWTTLTSPLPDMALRLKSAEMHAKFEALVRAESFDIIQVEGIEMARYALNLQSPISNLIFDDHNAEYVLQRTAFESDARNPARWHAALYSLIQWKKLEHYERATCRAARHIVVCSEADARAVERLLEIRDGRLEIDSRRSAVVGRITVIPNGVDTEFYTPRERARDEPMLVFTGKMDFRPNVDAMLWFAREILLRVRAEIPNAHLVIVGQKPAPSIRALAQQPGITVTGWVADTRPYIADAAIYIVPLRMGSGTRLKVLEAMAMGKAIVSTTRGIEGLALTPDREVILADTATEFARAIVALWRDSTHRRTLGQNARALAETRYDWRHLIPRFDAVYAGGILT